MIFAFAGDKHINFFGFKLRKIFVPFLLLLFTYVTVPDSSFTGHLFGMVAALMIKFCGFL